MSKQDKNWGNKMTLTGLFLIVGVVGISSLIEGRAKSVADTEARKREIMVYEQSLRAVGFDPKNVIRKIDFGYDINGDGNPDYQIFVPIPNEGTYEAIYVPKLSDSELK